MALVPFPNTSSPPPDPDDPDWDHEYEADAPVDDGSRMSFLEHLDELRKRIIGSLTALGVGTVVAFYFHNEIFDFVMRPMQALLPKGGTLIYTDPTEAFMLHVKLALIAGLILAAPIVFTQVWLFIAPGLYAKEKRMAIPFVGMSSVLFVVGAAFSHYIVFPLTWKFFVSFTSDYLTFMPRIEPAFSLYIKMLLAFGLVFQMPTIVLFLARMGVVTAGFLWRQIKYAILAIFIIAAVITPSGDMFTQTAMAGPMIGLYLLSILLAWAFGKKPKRNEDIPYDL